jgi:signal transduction histidine kinase
LKVARLRAAAQDVVITLALLIAGIGGTGPAGQDQLESSQRPDGPAYVLVILAAVPLVLRRRYPEGVLIASGAAVFSYLILNYPYGPILFTIPVAAYTLGNLLPLRAALRWVGGYYALILAATVWRMIQHYDESLWRQIAAWAVVSLAAFAAPLAIGVAVRVRRVSEAGVRAAQARRAVSDERLRMAHELHDSVGHGLAVIAMQAGVALHVLDREPDKVRESLEAIRDTSRRSLDGLRSQLEVMRNAGGDDVPRRPDVGLAELDVLFDRIRAGGLDVRAELGTGLSSVPADVHVAGYRIVQEALTNVLRHAGASRAEVSVRMADGEVTVDVVDDGISGPTAGDPALGSGSGIAGMQARAAALGGTVSAGPRPGGGFAVRARLPFSAGRASETSGPES